MTRGPVTVTWDGVDAMFALSAIEDKRDYHTGRLMELVSQRPPGQPADEEYAVAAVIASYTRAAAVLRVAVYGEPELALGDHFAGDIGPQRIQMYEGMD